jgi:UDP-N-acetylmuramoylalanine--D-glutamate ligase
VLVYGLAVAGAATARALVRRGVEVVVADDEVTPERRDLADSLGVELLDAPGGATLDRLLGGCDLLSPSPGVPEFHRVIDAARRHGVEIASEIELAYRWEQDRPGGPRPMIAVTGTDGKTTTTLLTVEMLRAAGVRSVDAGNTVTPLVDAIDLDLDALVVEATSFRLAWTPTFRADAAVWLNLAPDHLDWHHTMATYEAAKARIFANQRAGDVAIGFGDDPVVRRHVASAPARRCTFALAGADYHITHALLTGPAGPIAAVADMRRCLPHDVTNALAASAAVLETGLADADAIASALASFRGPAHRLEHLGTWDDIAWYNDSKATTPHAASAAIGARSTPLS